MVISLSKMVDVSEFVYKSKRHAGVLIGEM